MLHTLNLTDAELAHVKALVEMDLDAADGDAEFARVAAGSGVQTKIEALDDGREVVVHLNITVPKEDDRDADEIADEVVRNLNGGQTTSREAGARPIGGTLRGLVIVAPLAEEV